jgi:hypothetical protein
MGKSDDPHFQKYHRVLNPAQWSALPLSRVLLKLLIKTFAPKGTLLFGIDGTLQGVAAIKGMACQLERRQSRVSRIRDARL